MNLIYQHILKMKQKRMKQLSDSVLLRCIHYRLLSKIDLESKIERRKMFELLAEIYHIPKESRQQVVNELQNYGMILDSDKFTFTINRNF